MTQFMAIFLSWQACRHDSDYRYHGLSTGRRAFASDVTCKNGDVRAKMISEMIIGEKSAENGTADRLDTLREPDRFVFALIPGNKEFASGPRSVDRVVSSGQCLMKQAK